MSSITQLYDYGLVEWDVEENITRSDRHPDNLLCKRVDMMSKFYARFDSNLVEPAKVSFTVPLAGGTNIKGSFVSRGNKITGWVSSAGMSTIDDGVYSWRAAHEDASYVAEKVYSFVARFMVNPDVDSFRDQLVDILSSFQPVEKEVVASSHLLNVR